MSLASQGRRLPLPPFGHLEGQGSRTVGGGGVEDGISPPLLITSPSLLGSSSYSELFPDFHQGEGAPQGGSLTPREGSCWACSPLSGLLQQSFRGLEGIGLVQASDRLFTSELLRLANPVQVGDQPVGSLCGAEDRLDGLHRSEGSVPFRSQCILTAVVTSVVL